MKDRYVAWVAAVLVLAGTGCAGQVPQLQSQLLNLADLQRPTSEKYPKADAVSLIKELKIRLQRNPGRNKDSGQWLHHNAFIILTEKGLKRAAYRISVPRKAEISGLQARTIQPDGQVHWLDPEQVHDDEGSGSSEDSDYVVKVFAFPLAAVGSVLEVEYRIDYPWISFSHQATISGDLPVEKYRVQISGSSQVKYRVMSYNVDGAEPWRVDNRPSSWTLSWGLNDVPKTKTEAFRPHESLIEPRWAFLIQGMVDDGRVTHYYSSWDKSARFRGDDLYHDNQKYYKGFSRELDSSSCAKRDVACRVQVAQDWVTADLPFRGIYGWPGRSAQEVMDSGEASGVEKARVLYKLLKDSGIEARFAFFFPRLDGAVDRGFPLMSNLDRLALVVRKQKGLDRDIWIDPACEYCKQGELPHWLADTEALVVDYEFGALVTKPEYTGRFERVVGKVLAHARSRRQYAVNLDKDGAASVEVSNVVGAYDAQMSRQRLRERKADKWAELAEEFAKARIPQSRLVSHTPPVFDPKTWRSKSVLRFDAVGVGIRDGDSLVVPLTFFKWTFDRHLHAKSRKLPLVVAFPYDLEEVAELTVPEGWTVKSVPKAATATGPFDITVSAVREGRKVTVRRTLKGHPGRYETKDYAKARAALEAFRALRAQAVTFERVQTASVTE